MPFSMPPGMSTVSVLRSRVTPSPRQVPHSEPLGIAEPVPPQSVHVLAIWKPPCAKCTLVPDPPHDLQLDLLAPCFIPLPEQVLHVTMGTIVMVLATPFAASQNDMLTWTSMSSPCINGCWKPPRPLPNPPVPPKPPR